MGSEDPDLVDVVLLDSGDHLIRVIKQIREVVEMGLAEAKELAERTPSVIAAAVPAARAEAGKALLEEVGATVELRPAGVDSSREGMAGGGEAALKILVDRGTLSENELLDARHVLTDAPPDAHRKMVRMLTELHDLHKEGILSEAEFNTKKWEVLSRRWA